MSNLRSREISAWASAISPQKSWWLGFGLILAFWAWIGFHAYPTPFLDDTFFIGTAIHLAEHGVLANPRCDDLAVIGSTDHFFAYMPLDCYVLAAWLKLAGISSFSLHVFYTGLSLISSLLIYRLFPPRAITWICGGFVSLAVYGFLGGLGLRPDALGLVFFLLGLDIYWSKNTVVFFGKNLFLGLAVITYPNIAILAIGVSLSALIYQKVIGNCSIEKLKIWALAIVMAYGLAFLLFLFCIDALLVEFLQVFSRARHLGMEHVRGYFELFSLYGVSKWVVAQGSFLLLAIALFCRRRHSSKNKPLIYFLAISLFAFCVLAFSSINSATGIHLWAFACLIATLLIIVHESLGLRFLAAWVVVFAFAAYGHAHIVLQALLADPPPSQQQRTELLAKIAEMHPQRLNLDVYAVRELYDYRLPDNAYFYEWSSTQGFFREPRDLQTLPSNSLSVVSVKNAFPTPLSPDAGSHARPFAIFGHTVRGVYRNPFDLELIDNRFPPAQER